MGKPRRHTGKKVHLRFESENSISSIILILLKPFSWTQNPFLLQLLESGFPPFLLLANK